MWIWHLPAAYDLAARSDWWHAVDHLCLIATTTWFWAALHRQRVAKQYGVALAILRKVRKQLRAEQRTIAERRRILRRLAEAGIVDRVRSKDRVGVEELLRSAAGESCTLDALGVDLG